LVGPTAVGKTDLAIKLARELSCEIISCDSRQFYKEMSIGTAKPSREEMQGVKHHFIDSHSVGIHYSAGDFERDVDSFLAAYFQKNKVAIMVGGSGLFVQAVVSGLDDMPEAPLQLRAQLMERLQKGELTYLQLELKKLDQTTYNDIDLQNGQRVVRALEVCISTGLSYSLFKKSTAKKHNYDIIKVGIEKSREELYDRINKRVDKMLESGLVEEVEGLLAFKNQNALQTVGYKEVFGFLEKEYDYQTMVELLKRNTRRYAKRQMTWFKNKDKFEWFDAHDFERLHSFLGQKLK
jgi:tRNA dimethylallyltransferase